MDVLPNQEREDDYMKFRFISRKPTIYECSPQFTTTFKGCSLARCFKIGLFCGITCNQIKISKGIKTGTGKCASTERHWVSVLQAPQVVQQCLFSKFPIMSDFNFGQQGDT